MKDNETSHLLEKLEVQLDFFIAQYTFISTIDSPILDADGNTISMLPQYLNQIRQMLSPDKTMGETFEVKRNSRFDGNYYSTNLSIVFRELQTKLKWIPSHISPPPNKGQIFSCISDHFTQEYQLSTTPSFQPYIEQQNSHLKFEENKITFLGNFYQLELLNLILRNNLFHYPRFGSKSINNLLSVQPYPLIIQNEVIYLQYSIFPSGELFDTIHQISTDLSEYDEEFLRDLQSSFNFVLTEDGHPQIKVLDKLILYSEEWKYTHNNTKITIFLLPQFIPPGLLLNEDKILEFLFDLLLMMTSKYV